MREALETTDLFADIGILVAAGASTVFVISYGVFFSWRKTPAGRALMYFVLSLASVAWLAGFGRWLGPEYWGREFFRPVTWWAVAVTIGHLVGVLWSNWRVGKPGLDVTSRNRKQKQPR